MGTIKLRRGSGSPAGSLEQYEVAMDVADKNLYVSTDGSDAVILADNTENFLGTNTTELDITSDIDMNSKSILNAKQITAEATLYNEVFYNVKLVFVELSTLIHYLLILCSRSTYSVTSVFSHNTNIQFCWYTIIIP